MQALSQPQVGGNREWKLSESEKREKAGLILLEDVVAFALFYFLIVTANF